MAGLSLAVIMVILTHLRRPTWPVAIPLIFVTAMSLWAAVKQLGTLWAAQNWLLFAMDVVIVVAAVWVIVEVIGAVSAARKAPPVEWGDEDTDAPNPVRQSADVPVA